MIPLQVSVRQYVRGVSSCSTGHMEIQDMLCDVPDYCRGLIQFNSSSFRMQLDSGKVDMLPAIKGITFTHE